jgi:hypothetical protein
MKLERWLEYIMLKINQFKIKKSKCKNCKLCGRVGFLILIFDF